MKERAQDTSHWLVQAVVHDSLILRTVFQWINLVIPNPFPSKVFADPDEARVWLLDMLATERP
jgi:hypothetical protein